MIEVKWFDDERTIIIYECKSCWKLGNLIDALKYGNKLSLSVNHEVNMIFLILGAKRQTRALSNIGKILKRTRPLNLGMAILVTDNPTIRSIANIGKHIWNSSSDIYEVVPNMIDAMRLIDAHKQIAQEFGQVS